MASDFLTLDTSHVRLYWYSSTGFRLWFRWVFLTSDFSFIATTKRSL